MNTATKRPVPPRAHSTTTQARSTRSQLQKGHPEEKSTNDFVPAHTPPKSVLRYQGYTDQYGRQTIEQGNRRLIIERKRRKGMHWSVFLGLGMLTTTSLFLLGSWAISSFQENGMNAQYGYPRTYQVDQTVGHHDSLQHPSHFIFENLHGRVVIIELPAGEVRNARIYEGPPIVSSGDSTKIPVTGEFLDLNADGKMDMEVHIQGLTIVYINDGTQFVLQE